jgi:hypothetical protein
MHVTFHYHLNNYNITFGTHVMHLKMLVHNRLQRQSVHLFIEIRRRATSYEITLVSLSFIHMIYRACLGYSRIFSHKTSHTSFASFVSMMLETFFIHVEVLRLNYDDYDDGVVASSFGLPKSLDEAPFIVDETNLRQPRLIGWRTF